jgi:ElaB/YqjD/DUF883 family membrane-anchored ribosome-binding protein
MTTNKNNVETLTAAAEDAGTLADAYNSAKGKAANLIEAASDNIQEKANNVKKSVKQYLKEVDEESTVAQESVVDFISDYPLASIGLAFLSGMVLSKILGK